MKNNLTGIVISGLLHVGLFSWATSINNELVKEPAPSNNVVLSVSMFQAEVVAPPPPTLPLVKKVESPVPAPLKVAALPPITTKIETIETKVKPEIIPSPKLAKAKPAPKLKKPTKIKKIKKAKKKLIPHKVVKKPIRRKIIKKTPVLKKPPILKKTRKTIKKVAVKIQRRPQAITTPVKRPTIVQAHIKKRPIYSANKSSKPTNRQHTRPATKPPTGNAKKSAQRHHNMMPRPSSTTAQSSLNKNLSKQYKVRLQQLIASKKRYPKRARRRGHQGRVTVSFSVTHSGTISNIKILKSAKNKNLNIATINAIKQASGKLPYPKGMSKKSLTLRVTLSYVLS